MGCCCRNRSISWSISKIGADFEALGARMETAFQGNKQKAAEYFKWANDFQIKHLSVMKKL